MPPNDRTKLEDPTDDDMHAHAKTSSNLDDLLPSALLPPTLGFDLAAEQILQYAERVVFGHTPAPILVGNRYELIEVFATDDQGVTYRALDRQGGGDVAVKLLRPSTGLGTSPYSTLANLRTVMARLGEEPTNIARMTAGGVFRGQAYLVTDLLNARPLRAAQAAASSVQKLVNLYVAAGRALAYAHKSTPAIIHGEFGPDSALVTPDSDVRVTGFGLGVAREGPGACSPTRVTARYMAPEVRAGRPPDARSDQYSWCAALYEVLYGRSPPDLRINSWDEAAHTFGAATVNPRTDPPNEPPGLTRSPANDRHVPDAVRRALQRGLSPDPALRFPKMDDLLALLDVQVAAARQRPNTLRRWRTALLEVLGALAAALTLVSYARAPSLATPFSVCAESLNFDPSRCHAVAGDSTLCDQFARDYAAAVTEQCAADAPAPPLTQQYECLSDRREQWLLLVDIFAEQQLTLSVADLQRAFFSLGTPLECVSADMGPEDASSPLPPRDRTTRNIIRARIYEYIRQYDRGIEVLARTPDDIPGDELHLALIDYQLGRLLHHKGDPAAAEASLQRARTHALGAGNNQLLVDIDIYGIKNSARTLSRPEAADAYFREALQTLELVAPNQVQWALAADNYAHHVENLGLTDHAIAWRDAASKRIDTDANASRGLYAHERFDLALNHALVLTNVGRRQEARYFLDAAGAIATKFIGPDYPQQIELLRARARLADTQTDAAKALSEARAAVDRLLPLGTIDQAEHDRESFEILFEQLNLEYNASPEPPPPDVQQTLRRQVDELLKLIASVHINRAVRGASLAAAALELLSEPSTAAALMEESLTRAKADPTVDPKLLAGLQGILAANLYNQSKGDDPDLLGRVVDLCTAVLTGHAGVRTAERLAQWRANVVPPPELPGASSPLAPSELETLWAGIFYLRGVTRALQGDEPGAASDLQQALERARTLNLDQGFQRRIQTDHDSVLAHKPLTFRAYTGPYEDPSEP